MKNIYQVSERAFHLINTNIESLSLKKISFAFRFILILTVLFSLRLTISCGQNNGNVDFSESLYGELKPLYERSDFSEKTLTEEEFILSDMYSGKMVFNLDKSEKSQIITSDLSSSGYNVKSLVNNIGKYRRVVNLMRLHGAKKINDLSNWQSVDISGDDAVGLYKYLIENGYKVIPKAKTYPSSISSIIDLEIGQRYLTEDEFDVYGLWDVGITGQGIRIVDYETDAFQLNHADLPATNTINPCVNTAANPYMCDAVMGHATAVAGILSSLDNNHGTIGMSHGSTLISANGGWSVMPYGSTTDILRPGDVLLFEVQVPGKKTPYGTGCGSSPATSYGCIPAESSSELFDEIQMLTEYGVTVVSGAGNGTVSLDSPSTYWSYQKNLSLFDSGSILVSAVHGSGSMVKAAYSNTGTPLDLSGWGYNVLTTGYAPQDYLEGDYPWAWPYQWSPVTWITNSGGGIYEPENNDATEYYANNFGGTSAAAAQVAASAALIQSYAKSVLGNSETRFIYPQKILEILQTNAKEMAGSSSYGSYSKCKIVDWNVNVDADDGAVNSCSSGYVCAGSNPAGGGSCTADADCKIYGGFETIGSDCVAGKCGGSFCAKYCNAGGTCSNGWLPTTLNLNGNLTCVCHPPFESKNSEYLVADQPNLGEAKIAVNSLIVDLQTQYPQLFNGGQLTDLQQLQSLRDLGVGLICGEVDPVTHEVVGMNDPACPEFLEEDLWPSGNMPAKKLDFDGDGRADLVSWSKGEFKIDLSSIGTGGDNYGEWDLVATYTPSVGTELPFVADMDSDTRADFVVYSKSDGKWYIKLTKNNILYSGTTNIVWDKIVDYGSNPPCVDSYSMNYNESVYARPFVGNFLVDNGFGGPADDDVWNDLVVACSNGIFSIDRGHGSLDDFGEVDFDYQYILDEHLANAPGWAYIPATVSVFGMSHGLFYLSPFGLNNAGEIASLTPWFSWSREIPPNKRMIPVSGYYVSNLSEDKGMIRGEGDWVSLEVLEGFAPLDPSYSFAGDNCNPVVGDFDGDGLDDRALQCPDKWKIVYSSNNEIARTYQESVRTVNHTFDVNEVVLPGKPVYGGTNYNTAIQLMNMYKSFYNTPPPVLIDMVKNGLN